MRRQLPTLLAAAGLAACTARTGVVTTPTFAPARFVPQVTASAPSAASAPARARHRRAGHDGASIVAQANQTAMVDPDESTMRGATWVIDDVQPSSIYRVRTATGRVTTILLPPGERFNGAVGGDVESFLINVAYAGPRPAVSILPRTAAARGNLQLVTTGGFYSFDLIVNQSVAMNLVDVGHEGAPSDTVAGSLPQPQGDFTRLAPVSDGTPLPAWAPAEAWADSIKMVVRFNGPLPTLPALFAGMQGEQLVSYRSQVSGDEVYLITSRRVTEAELRLGSEKVRLSVDPDAVRSGSAAAPMPGVGGWRAAETLPLPMPSVVQGSGSPVLLMLQPPAAGSASPAAPSAAAMPARTGDQQTAGTVAGLAQPAAAAAGPVRQPMADHLLQRL